MQFQSSICAISQIKFAGTRTKKIIWLLVLFIGLFASSYQIFQFLKLYFTYPIMISYQENLKSNLDFPAVTVCNHNRMKKDFQDCVNVNIKEVGCLIFPGIILINGMTLSERNALLSCKRSFYGNFLKKKRDALFLLQKYMEMDLENRQAVGQNAQEFIRYCSFQGYVCSPDDIRLFQSLRYGNCYTFNKKSTKAQKEMKFFSSGYTSGLDLVLNINRSQYLTFTPSIGVHVLIHHPTEIPNPDDKGVNIIPGFETSIAIQQKVIYRLPAPYPDRCRDYKSYGNIRSKEECDKMCLQQRSLEACDCADPTLSYASNMTFCDMRNRSQVCCLNKVQDRITTKGPPCDCPMDCLSVYYDQQVSKSVWPSEESLDIKEKIIKHEYLMHLRDNMLRLKVYYDSLNQKEFTQRPKFVGSEIFSNMGGELSLWLGFSLFALFEIIEAFIFVYNRCIATKQRIKRESYVNSESVD